MRTFDLIFNGSNDISMIIDYSYFLIISDGGGPIDIDVRKNTGFNKISGVNAGFGLKLNKDSKGKEFIFRSNLPQTVKIFVGDDEAIYTRLNGAVSITGTPTVINGGGVLTSITNPVLINEYFTYTGSWKSNTIYAAGAVDTIITPAANVNGAVIHSLSFISANSSSTPAQNGFVSKNSLPANVLDGDLICIGNSTSNIFSVGFLSKPVHIPAGRGLYYFNTIAENIASLKMCLYTLL